MYDRRGYGGPDAYVWIGDTIHPVRIGDIQYRRSGDDVPTITVRLLEAPYSEIEVEATHLIVPFRNVTGINIGVGR